MKRIFTLISAIAFLTANCTDYSNIIAKLRTQNINQPISKTAFKKLNGGFWMTWGQSNGGDCAEYLDNKVAEKRMKSLKNAGYTGIVVSGRHWRVDWLDENHLILKQLKQVCDLAHKYGMFVISHFDLIQFSLKGNSFALKHPNWWQLDLQTGAPFSKFCVNNLEFKNFYIEYLRDMIKKTGVDGFMLDELSFAQENKGFGSCFCNECRKKFKLDTGVEFPTQINDKRFYQVPNPWYSLFCQWRANCVNHFQRDVSRALIKEYPDIFFVSYSTGFIEPELLLTGWNYFSHFKYIDSIGVEPPQGSTIVMLPRMYTRCKLRAAVADALGKPLWVLGQTPETKENLLFMSGFFKAMRHSIWSPRNIPATQTAWKHWPDPAKCRTVAAAALICSELTINSSVDKCGDSYYQNRELEGWAGALTARNLTYDVIISEAMTDKNLKNYPVVILPNSAVLSAKEQKILSNYLTNGGIILTSGRFGFDPVTKKSGLRPAIEIPMMEHKVFSKPTKLSDNILVKSSFAKKPKPQFRKVGKGFIGIYPATFASAESRIHTPGGSTNFKVWDSPMANYGITENVKLIDSWFNRAFAINPLKVTCSTPNGLLTEMLKDDSGKLIIALLDVTGRDNTEILKKSKLSGEVTLKILGKTNPKSFQVLSPGKKLTPKVDFQREKGYDIYNFKVDNFPVYSQIEVKYE